LTELQIASALPTGLNLVSATSLGAVDQATGYVQWAVESGLAAGASTQMSVSAVVDSPGELTNDECTAGFDVIGNRATDCASLTVS
jgi:hypothetical protein